MKQKTLVSTFGSLILILSAVFLITGCPDKLKSGINDVSTLIVAPTEKAYPNLANTSWTSEIVKMSFELESNIAYINMFEALYTVEGNSIKFDISRSIAINKEMTVDKLIAIAKIKYQKVIEQLKNDLAKETDPEKKKIIEERIKALKEDLKYLENITPEDKEIVEKQAKVMKEMAHALAPYAKFTGVFNKEKTELTIENFPSFDQNTKTVKPTKVVLKKI